jgi:hypothetical protein
MSEKYLYGEFFKADFKDTTNPNIKKIPEDIEKNYQSLLPSIDDEKDQSPSDDYQDVYIDYSQIE